MKKLRDWRKAANKTLEEAGASVGITAAQWQRYESGIRKVGVDRLALVARVTGISMQELRPDLAGLLWEAAQ